MQIADRLALKPNTTSASPAEASRHRYCCKRSTRDER
jgi:hypothetical protein